MVTRGEVLVAIMNSPSDWEIATYQNWYRIPVSSVDKWLKDCWPPQWLAFYQTNIFGGEKHAVNYYAKVREIRRAYRWQLLPEEPRGDKSDREYYQVLFEPLQRLAQPIPSSRFRRIVFIPTTWSVFTSAEEINDLWVESPLENKLWVEFKRRRIPAERQEYVQVKRQSFFLDFAIYCAKGKIDVETDGDAWHATPDRAAQDNVRDNLLETSGWRILRFNGAQIHEQIENYCVPLVVENINKLGGLDEGKGIPRLVREYSSSIYQLDLWDDL